ncbi:MAG: hypothetical protein KIT81_00535 [Alphaproteobacteria bacterium]|nr:hypothetical protein [Alphaproteobacteria bacterium]
MIAISEHAKRRCQTRGIRSDFLVALIVNADMDFAVGDNCRMLRVSRRQAKALSRYDNIDRYGVIWSDDNQKIVSVIPIHDGPKGRRYRRQYCQ